jgi:hypothetical protein
MVVYLMVGDLADPAAEERGGLAWGVRREEPNRDAHGLAAFFFLEWIGGTAMILFFPVFHSRQQFDGTRSSWLGSVWGWPGLRVRKIN